MRRVKQFKAGGVYQRIWVEKTFNISAPPFVLRPTQWAGKSRFDFQFLRDRGTKKWTQFCPAPKTNYRMLTKAEVNDALIAT